MKTSKATEIDKRPEYYIRLRQLYPKRYKMAMSMNRDSSRFRKAS